MFFETRQPIIAIIIKRLPAKTIGFLPNGLSARTGKIIIVVQSPAKNIEPKRPILILGSHRRSSLSGLTQLSMYSESDVTAL